MYLLSSGYHLRYVWAAQWVQVRSGVYQVSRGYKLDLFGGHKLGVSAVSESKLDLACIQSSVGTS